MAAFLPNSEYNKNEISITAIERKALLTGFLKASEHHLNDLNSLVNPSPAIQEMIEQLTRDIKEIKSEYGTYQSE